MKRRHLYLQWDSNDLCNLNCQHCYHEQEGNPEHFQVKSILKTSEVINMIDDLCITAKRWNMVPDMAISGGEPLLRKDLYEILEYTQKKGVRIKLLSNGTLITSDIAKKIAKYNIDGIQISIDGKRELHNKIRGKSFAYDKALEGVRNASNAGIIVNIAMTLMQSNKDDFEDVIKSAINNGAKKVGFKSYVPDPILGENDPNFVDASTFYQLAIRAKEFADKYKSQIRILTSDVLFQILESNHPLKEKAKNENTFLCGCSAGYRAISVLSDGTVYPCRRLPINVGHISDGLSRIFLENSVMKNLRDMNSFRNNTNCDKVVHCRGCRAVAYAVTGDYLHKDPMCFKDLVNSN